MIRTIYKPKKQHEEVLYYLHFMSYAFSLKDVINQSMFFKFQTRLGELESIHGTLATRQTIIHTNKFGNRGDYKVYYRSVSKERLIEIFNTL